LRHKVVPVTLRLPSNTEYLKHVSASRRNGVMVRPLGNLVRITVGRTPENDALIAAAGAAQGARKSQ
jgi:histidinol-phosphate/aromatic aminotransferase/cobyric acid decarboxylase-like protein